MATGEEQLRTFLQDIAKKQNYEFSKIDIKPISSGGANYTADLYEATISEPLKEDIHIFGKVGNMNDEFRGNIGFNTYEAEAVYYSELTADFERIYNKYNVPDKDRLVLPKYYGHIITPGKEIMLLENLQVRGFKSFDRMKTFNWEYAATAVTQMAKFHAVGLSFRHENPVEFEKYLSQFKMDLTVPAYQDVMKNVLQNTLENGLEALNSDQKRRLLNFYSSMDSLTTLMAQIDEDKTVLVHGDFRPNNLMHRRRNGKLEIIILDYQTMRMGNPVGDLLYFIFFGSDEEFRRLHYQHLVDHYFTELTLALKQLHVDVTEVYPRKVFDTNMREMAPWGLLTGLIAAVAVTVDPDEAPSIGEDFTTMEFKPSQLAQQRIAGIVRDFIRWEVL